MSFAAVFTVPSLLRNATGVLPVCSLALLKHTALRYCTANGKMKSKRKADHLERTANDFRQEMISKAKVCGIANESETVKRLRLAIADKEFTFKAGQWVDFFIPGVAVVGGFSICSSPGLLEQEGVLELAVKQTTHPPAHWVHTQACVELQFIKNEPFTVPPPTTLDALQHPWTTLEQCTLDAEVALRVGGNFFFDPQPSDSSTNLVLIAGGVGINPLFSILLHVADLHRTVAKNGTGYQMGTTDLFYCAKNTNELLFRKHIIGLTDAFPGKISCSFHVTQQSSPICEKLQPYVKERRISANDLKKNISKDTLCYICGPPPMIESVSKMLKNLGISEENIFFEKWW